MEFAMKALFTTFTLLLALFGVSAAEDQVPGQPDPTRIVAGTYIIEPTHTQIAFTINHFGFNPYHGLFGGSTGSLTLDPAYPQASALTIETPIEELVTTSDKLNAHLKTADFFDTATYPTARFQSTRIEVTDQRARITGDFTLRGVTRPLVLQAEFTGAGLNPVSEKQTIAFRATTAIRRSDYGMTFIVPLVGDDVILNITAAFELAEPR
jgi:polyisoprenoid-binding protein YceI